MLPMCEQKLSTNKKQKEERDQRCGNKKKKILKSTVSEWLTQIHQIETLYIIIHQTLFI